MNDRDPALSVLLEQLTPSPTATPDWQDALARAKTRTGESQRRSRPRKVVAYVSAAGAVSVVVALLLVSPWRDGPNVVGRASAALMLKPDTILHERFEDVLTDTRTGKVSRASTELWLGSNDRFRSIKLEPGGAVQQQGRAGAGQPLLIFRPGTDTIEAECGPDTPQPRDPVALIRHALADGTMRPDGTTLINGRTVERLRAQSPGETDYFYVDPHSYQPVELRSALTRNGQRTVDLITFLTYAYLPATPANVRLTSLPAQHPSATLTGISSLAAQC